MNEKAEVVLNAILTRRSVRRFTEEKVDDKTIDALLQTALYAATGGNHQETRFIVVQDEAMLAKLTTMVREIFAARPLDPTDYQNKTAIVARKPHFDFRYHAPLMILAVAPIKHDNSMADSALALGNMMIAANGMGLGSCYVNQLHWLTEDPNMRPVLLSLGMKEDENCFGTVIFGWPKVELSQVLPPRVEGRVVR